MDTSNFIRDGIDDVTAVDDAGNGEEKARKTAAESSAPLATEHAPDAIGLGFENATGPDGVKLICAADLVPEPIRWMWDGWLSCGKLHMLAGSPGTGKTTIALSLAATITSGGRWPDGTRCAEPGNVLIWSGEDDPTDTLLPRLSAMGADTSRIFFVGDVTTAGEIYTFDPAKHIESLVAKAEEVGNVRLVICDPIVNAVAGNSHNNTEVRRALQPLVDMAPRLDAIVLGVSHFSKKTAGGDPLERVTGSLAFGALPRVVLVAAKVEEEDGKHRRILVRVKSNIGADRDGFDYALEQTQVPGHAGLFASKVIWGGQITGSARDLMANAETAGGEGGAIAEAGAWVRGALAHGPTRANDVKKLAEQQGMAWRTVQLARERIGATSRREGFGKGSTVLWELPIDARNAIDASPPRAAPMDKPCAYEEPSAAENSGEEVF